MGDRALGEIRYAVGPSPVGSLFLARAERGICAVAFCEGTASTQALARIRDTHPGQEPLNDPATVGPILARITGFLDGSDGCADLDLDLDVGTPFQRRVWDELRKIPRGATRTYGELAAHLGVPGGARAIGAACGANPVALLVPCHRVVRAGGALGGYYWGLERKRALLDLERPQGT